MVTTTSFEIAYKKPMGFNTVDNDLPSVKTKEHVSRKEGNPLVAVDECVIQQ